jgi:hypothetical protein
MTLEFRLPEMPVHVQENYSRDWIPLLESAIWELGAEPAQIERIFITVEETHGASIQEILPGEGYTNGNGLIGYGKTISRFDIDNKITSSIAIRSECMGILVGALSNGWKIRDLKVEHQIFAYGFLHEVGHVKDAANRPDALRREPLVVRPFKIKNWQKYYLDIVVSEYAACVFCGPCVSKELLLAQFEHDASVVVAMFQKVHDQRRAYRGPDDLFDLATDVCGACWLAVIQAAKHFAHRAGNPELREVNLDWKKWFPEQLAEKFVKFEQMLTLAWSKYPGGFDLFSDASVKIWREIGFDEGFRFEEHPDGDGLFFNRVDLKDVARILNWMSFPPNFGQK